MTKSTNTILFVLCIGILFTEASGWWRRRRRRSPPPCRPRNCQVSSWTSFSSCSYPCGRSGTQWRERYLTGQENSCGSCPYQLSESRSCNRNKCYQLPNSISSHSTGCYCRAGFTGTCCGSDVNECNSRPCQHTCTNTYGSYTCSCYPCYNKRGTRCDLRQCRINGNHCYSYNTVNPSNRCQQCDSNNQHQWTNNNNLPCSDKSLRTKNDRCVNGACVGTPYSCLSCETHDGSGCLIKSGFSIIQHGGQWTCEPLFI